LPVEKFLKAMAANELRAYWKDNISHFKKSGYKIIDEFHMNLTGEIKKNFSAE